MKVNGVKIKYLRRDRNGKEVAEFWANREVGQIIKDSAFKGLVDEVLEIIVVSKEESIEKQTKRTDLEGGRKIK